MRVMDKGNDKKVYMEPASELVVEAECDILVVGGGAAGHSAAIAAARAGAKNIILLERYGYMGGDVTGGYVIMVPNLSWYDKSFVRGLQEEWFTRLSIEIRQHAHGHAGHQYQNGGISRLPVASGVAQDFLKHSITPF